MTSTRAALTLAADVVQDKVALVALDLLGRQCHVFRAMCLACPGAHVDPLRSPGAARFDETDG
jgi:hypothetical protein